jgi:hypothetical protein
LDAGLRRFSQECKNAAGRRGTQNHDPAWLEITSSRTGHQHREGLDWVRRILHLAIGLLSVLSSSCGKATRSSANDGSGAASSASGGDGGSATTSTSSADGGSGGGSGGVIVGDTGTGGTWSALPLRANGHPIYTRVQRLTNSQYEHAVTDILGFDAPANLAENFQEPIQGATDFTNNELVLDVGEREVIDYEAASEAAAALATGSDEALEALYAGTDPEGFVQSFGRRAFRRPLTSEEQAKYLEVFEQGETLYGAGFANGAALVIRAMLQSPHFLYRTELGAVGEQLDGYELAAKLSLWLVGSTRSMRWRTLPSTCWRRPQRRRSCKAFTGSSTT